MNFPFSILIGSGVLTSLRDAILTFETIFSGFFGNFIKITQKVKSINEVFDASLGDTCKFECPDNTFLPQPNKFYKATGKEGCSNFGVEIDSEYLPSKEIELCCNEQNNCYGICRKDKEMCDVDFKRCLYKFCDSNGSNQILLKGGF